MTTRFYAPPEHIQGDRLVLPEDEARHAVRVLRMSVGDTVTVVDGAGGWYEARLDQADKRGAAGTILAHKREVGEPAFQMTLGVALLKNRNRFEVLLEKAAELGVHTLVPLLTSRTERNIFKRDRFEKILIAAMKQCGRSRLVVLAAPQLLREALSVMPTPVLLAHEKVDAQATLWSWLAEHRPLNRLSLLIGPEGGFSEEEVLAAAEAGATAVSLGPRRLRAETAALAAVATTMLALER